MPLAPLTAMMSDTGKGDRGPDPAPGTEALAEDGHRDQGGEHRHRVDDEARRAGRDRQLADVEQRSIGGDEEERDDRKPRQVGATGTEGAHHDEVERRRNRRGKVARRRELDWRQRGQPDADRSEGRRPCHDRDGQTGDRRDVDARSIVEKVRRTHLNLHRFAVKAPAFPAAMHGLQDCAGCGHPISVLRSAGHYDRR